MKRLVSLITVFMLVLLPAIPANAQPPLYGEMNLEYNLDWAGPSLIVPDWEGTITIDSIQYGMVFYNFWSGKPFAFPFKGSADQPVIFFGEKWEIYDLGTGITLMWGFDEGVSTSVNSKFRMNGSVEYATGVFDGWQGRTVHMSGIIELYPFGAPHFAVGPFRIN
jgi:hypothetical protein